eukprot:3414126-Pyramimonas_sp.AAC.1
MLHRGWLCRANHGAKAYSATDDIVPQAAAEAEALPAFWFRGIIPADRARVPPPAEVEELVITNSNHTTLSPG